MPETHADLTEVRTLADLLDRLGGVPPQRVRFQPVPGAATEADVLAVERAENRLCELIDGVLVEKVMGFRESVLALALGEFLRAFVRARNLGIVAGADGMMRLFPGMVRIPDVAFIGWERLPARRMPSEAIPALVPDLAVEVLSAGNAPAEMARKRDDYFAAGVRLVWYVDLERRIVTAYAGLHSAVEFTERDVLTADPVLPGFALPLRDLFSELDRRAE